MFTSLGIFWAVAKPILGCATTEWRGSGVARTDPEKSRGGFTKPTDFGLLAEALLDWVRDPYTGVLKNACPLRRLCIYHAP